MREKPNLSFFYNLMLLIIVEKMPAGLGYSLGIRGGIIVLFGFFLMLGGFITNDHNLQNIGIWIQIVGVFLFALLSLLLGIKRGKWKAI